MGVIAASARRDRHRRAGGARRSPGSYALRLAGSQGGLGFAGIGYRQETLTFAALGALCIVALLSWQLRSARRALHIVLPLAAAVVVTAAALVVLGKALTLFHLVALLLVVGIGSNYALFFERTRNDGRERMHTVLALTLCCTTTIVAFGLLALSATPVLRAIGGTVALGAVIALVYCAVLIRPDAAPSRLC